MRCRLRKAEPYDQQQLADAFARSAEVLAPWSAPPSDIARYIIAQQVYLLLTETGELIAHFTISGVIRGLFHSAYLGYNCFVPFQGRGYMREGLQLLLHEAFGALNLHRLEANIQPGNSRSINLVKQAGFSCEGYSPQYLRIGGEWQDHERWAIINPHWRPE